MKKKERKKVGKQEKEMEETNKSKSTSIEHMKYINLETIGSYTLQEPILYWSLYFIGAYFTGDFTTSM